MLLSIIPKHIASQVGEEVSNFLSNLTNEGVTERFSETFIETHKNVSILYADICGFTPLTEKFTKKVINGKEVHNDRIEDLVATLNDLFAKFDEAADVRNKGDASFYFPLPRTVTYFTKISSSQSVILLWRLLK